MAILKKNNLSIRSSEASLDYFLFYYLILYWVSIIYLLTMWNYFEEVYINNFFWLNHDFPSIENVKNVKGFGVHYFGDFLHSLTVTSNPVGSVSYWPYLPLSNVVLVPLLGLEYLTAYLVYLIFFLPFVFIGLWFLYKSVNLYKFIFFTIMCAFTNLGFIYLIDRGNLQLVVTACISLAFFAFLNGKKLFFGFLIATAAAIKLWPLLFLFVFLKRREFKYFSISISSFFVLLLSPMFFMDMGKYTIFNYLQSQFIYMKNSNEVFGIFWHAGAKNSSLSAILRFLELYYNGNFFLKIIISNYIYIQIGIFIALSILYLASRVKNIIIETLFLASILLLLPGAQYGYSFSLIMILIPVVISHNSIVRMNLKLGELKEYEDLEFGKIILPILAIISVPWTIRIPDNSGDTAYPMDLNTLLNPIGLSLLIIFCLLILYRNANNTR